MALIKPKFYLSMLTVALFTITALCQPTNDQSNRTETNLKTKPEEINNQSIIQTSTTTEATLEIEAQNSRKGKSNKKNKYNTVLINRIVVSFLLIVMMAVMIYIVSIITSHKVESNGPRQQEDIALTSNLLACDKENV